MDTPLSKKIAALMVERFHIVHQDGAIVEEKDCRQVAGFIEDLIADEGYTTPVNSEGLINFGTEENPVMIHKDSLPFSPHNGGGYIDIPKDLRMTGQEWFTAFYEEIKDRGPNESKPFLEAAKRASGIIDD